METIHRIFFPASVFLAIFYASSSAAGLFYPLFMVSSLLTVPCMIMLLKMVWYGERFPAPLAIVIIDLHFFLDLDLDLGAEAAEAVARA
jgi:hypothetical protein